MAISRREFVLTTGTMLPAVAAGAVGRDCGGTAWRPSAKESIRTLENVWIPLNDGHRLAMRLWLPTNAEHSPVPVVLEYLPYRKRDNMRRRDQAWGESFAPYGFGAARVDIRGTGESDGVLLGEYLQQEQDDALEVIAWLARQPWCNGSVGMRGISWSGFNSLQVAAAQPPALKAIIAQCASDNRYTDDSHYVGGALTFDDLEWAAEFKNDLVTPPDPELVGERWREMWLQRLGETPPIATQWLRHQRYDAFWQHGSIAVDYSKIKCPVYVVDGQIDCYRDFVLRVLANLKVPRKGLIGPWGHRFPQHGDPGPGLEWVEEEVRWWTQWLKGVDTGVMQGPMFRAYMETRTASEVWPKDVPGRWVAETTWPSPRIIPRTYFMNSGALATEPEPPKLLRVTSHETVGLTKREWYINEMGVDLPPDQSPDDARSLVFDSPVLTEDIEILGKPAVSVRLSSDQPVAKLAVRLNEVTAEGKSWNVSYGVLNLTHRDGHENPAPLLPDRQYDVEVSCYFTAHRFKQGSHIRVALTESLWPMLWPSPRKVNVSVTAGRSRLVLPVRPPAVIDGIPFLPIIRNAVETRDIMDRKILATKITQSGPDPAGLLSIKKEVPEPDTLLADIGTTLSGGSVWTRSIREGDPNSSLWTVEWRRQMRRTGWNIRTQATVELSSTPDHFRLRESIVAWNDEKEVFRRAWDTRIKRDLL
jgi:uncharacterized protein